jgi:hypothetical protein
LASLIQGLGQSFEDSLSHVMAIPASQDIDMEVQISVRTEGPEKFFYQLETELPSGSRMVRLLVMEVRSAAQIYGHLNQGLVHGKKNPSVTFYSNFIAQGLNQAFPENNGGIFDAVMIIDLEIATDFNLEIEQAMPAEQGEHMIEKRDAGLDGGSAGPIDHQVDGDSCLCRLAL